MPALRFALKPERLASRRHGRRGHALVGGPGACPHRYAAGKRQFEEEFGPVWPPLETWVGAVLFIETSEEAPTVREVRRWLRSYGAQGILERVAAILIGRPGGHQLSIADHQAYDDGVLGVVRHELGLATPIIAGMDFGHTDPFFVVPYGVRCGIDCDAQRFSIVEGAVV